MSKGLKFSPLLVALLLCIGLVAYLYLPKEAEEKSQTSFATSVVTHVVKKEQFEILVEALGTAYANESVTITAQTSDIVQKIHFDDSDVVESGQLLLELNNKVEKARIAELDVSLKEAERQLKRISDLAKNNVASEQLLDEQEARVKSLKAQYLVSETQLEELQIRAPFDGLLGVREVSIGAFIKPGDLVTTLDDLSTVKVDFEVAESHLSSVAIGQSIRSTSIAYKDKIFEGKIASIGSRVDASTRSVKVRAVIDNEDLKLRPGMLLQILLQKQVLNTLVLPESALVPVEDKQFVFVIKDNIAKKVEVEVGDRKPGIVQILGGLEAGDVVVTEGTLKLRDGSSVAVVADSEV
ncbi:efflux RND transporter periplasmic adaptor subunit [Paraglaciecola marina]|uniref:efflux RND transporter periplasmic adaptor subunit n=1 Tax=Paraglaciecola marina TaxID=2500157 RepID=UPI00105FA345|nr:efflux RND transporter periplasmic adaptor subunit [Paraglaciecola marina]